uniref:Ribosomal RNA-processing protein 4 n=1 Tax=Percolomonas cosmopolitus TaxID=63605 RepID=A0A7S1PK35_9EUKA|eukprot:CAMPEP_0117440812 /NCGR_PEP_ID=MMETSP0759-20121206/3289_1 /TAXON_ID=63605 /ORGANISM="Percolomonas cosmopolitus, Strain WS" /LENGTH=356 /DNA_ID=CAMNT_0005232601 /DNA_START=81 /DNA_END=1151 /DNA_ORIENTATION=+
MTDAATSKHLQNQMHDNDESESSFSIGAISGNASSQRFSSLSGRVVTPGAFITSETAKYLHGHGTILESYTEPSSTTPVQCLRSTQAGLLHQLGSLLLIEPVRHKRYLPHTGDTIIGRVTKLAIDSWNLNINASQDAQLRLSSVNLPQIQRRKTYKDQLQMRQMFSEGDLLVSEVLEARPERRVNLQTRSSKYGKLGRGLLVQVDASLMRRQKQHFWRMPGDYEGVRVILGMNGFLWIDRAVDQRLGNRSLSLVHRDTDQHQKNQTQKDNEFHNQVNMAHERALHDKMARVRNAIVALHKMFIPIYSETILDVLDGSKQLESKDMTESKMLPVICASAAGRIQRQQREEQKKRSDE